MSKIEKSAATAMKKVQECRTAAITVKGEAERLAYANVPAGDQREALLAVALEASKAVEAMNTAEHKLATVVQEIRKAEAK